MEYETNEGYQLKALLVTFTAALLVSCAGYQNKLPVANSGIAKVPLEHCNTDLRYLNQVLGWQGEWPSQWQAVVAGGPEQAEMPLKHWSSASQAITSTIDKLRQGIKMKETAPRAVVLRVQQQVTDLSTELSTANSKYTFNNVDHQNASIWNNLIRKNIAPAVAEFETFLREEYLPEAQESPGLSITKGGSKCFLNAVTWWTSLSFAQHEIEKIGWQYINKTRAEMLKTGNDGEKLEDILGRLRATAANDKTTAEELIRISENALARAYKKTHLVFSKQVPQEIVVTKLPQHLQAAFPAGRYKSSPKGASAAQYIINPSRPNERRLMAEVIAFHEGIPGHHLWATFPRDIPSTKYNTGLSGLTEGWAIYSEYLADEMDLFSSTLDRQGMIAKHLWAASRLIVEPGLHLRGWSREKAINFMQENTVLSRAEIELEVDRYIAMPGQSLSYILGADVILNERKRAREVMGTTFDIKAFHDIVLGAGARPLSVVQDDIRAWVRSSHYNASISRVWTAINENFGGENFNPDKWVKTKEKFISQDFQTLNQEYAAIESILETLDEPSVRLLRRKEKEAFLNEISGQLPAGIGLVELLSIDIDERTNILTIITCLPQTAAAKAGLRSGDQIVRIDGIPTKGLSLAQSMSKLRGIPGVDLSLDILRGSTPLTFTLTREAAREFPPPVRTFTQRYGDKTIGYIQYLIIAKGSASDFQKGLSSLIRQGVDAIVLDLRNNPGGTVADALAVADLFLEKGAPIATLKAGQDKIVKEYYAKEQATWTGPTAILQNQGSASAAEVIASALRANNKAIIVGEKSYGKGLLHTLTPLADGAAVMFHVGRLISPDNRDILHEMIIPDHLIPQTPSPIMSSNQREVGTATDLQYRHAIFQIFKQE